MKSFIFFCCLVFSLNAELYSMDIPDVIADSDTVSVQQRLVSSSSGTYNILSYTANAKVQDKTFADIVGKYIEWKYEHEIRPISFFPLFKNVWGVSGINTNFNIPVGASLLFPGPYSSCSTLDITPYYAYDFDSQRICAQSNWIGFVTPSYYSVNGIKSYFNETNGPRAIASTPIRFTAAKGNSITTSSITTSKIVTTTKNEAGNVTGTTESITTESQTVIGDGTGAAIGMFQVVTPTAKGTYTLGIGFYTRTGVLIEGNFTLTAY